MFMFQVLIEYILMLKSINAAWNLNIAQLPARSLREHSIYKLRELMDFGCPPNTRLLIRSDTRVGLSLILIFQYSAMIHDVFSANLASFPLPKPNWAESGTTKSKSTQPSVGPDE